MGLKKKIEYSIDKKGCHICTSHGLRNGYPTIRDKSKHKKLSRYIYEKYKGIIPKDMMVLHRCDNKLCINPKHLRVGTAKENINEALDRGLFKFGDKCKHAKITGKQAIEIFNSKKTDQQLARMYGICASSVSAIKLSKNWRRYLESKGFKPKNLGRAKWERVWCSRFTPKIIDQMRKEYNNKTPVKSILTKYNISNTHFYNLVRKSQ